MLRELPRRSSLSMTPRISALRWAAVGAVAGLLVGGVAWAVVIAPDNAGDKYYACVSSAGVVKASTIKLNAPPGSCPASTDVVHSWAAVGATGPSGVTGATGPAAPGPQTRTIRVTDQSFTVPAGGNSEVVGPVDTSECRSITVRWAGAFVNAVYVYDVDPGSGSQAMTVPYQTFRSYGPGTSGGGSARPTWPTIYSSGVGISAVEDSGGSVGVSTSVQFASDSPGGGTITHVWLVCVPWT